MVVSEQVREVSRVKCTRLHDTLHRAWLKAQVEADNCTSIYLVHSPATRTGCMAKAVHTFALLGNRWIAAAPAPATASTSLPLPLCGECFVARVEPQFWLIKSSVQLRQTYTHTHTQATHSYELLTVFVWGGAGCPKAGNTFDALDKWLLKNAWNTRSKRRQKKTCLGHRSNNLPATPTRPQQANADNVDELAKGLKPVYPAHFAH